MGSRRRIAGCALLLSGCHEDPGELDRAVVHELSRTRGEAVGSARSGIYPIRLRAEDCECPDLDVAGLAWTSACAPLLMLGSETIGDVEVVETDGLLLVRLPHIGGLTGPIEPDGTFSVGAIVDLGSPVSSGAVIVRGDGSFQAGFDVTGSQRTSWAIEGRFRRRLAAEIADDSTDCTEHLRVEDTRLTLE